VQIWAGQVCASPLQGIYTNVYLQFIKHRNMGNRTLPFFGFTMNDQNHREFSLPAPFPKETTPTVELGALRMHTEGDTLFVAGDVDLYQAASFREVAERHLHDTTEPCINLREVDFLDSAGLATLLALSRLARKEEKTLRVVAVGNPRRVLRITGLDSILSVED
jgi:anti-anti-sigma factor